MIRLIARIILNILSNAFGLIVASILVDGFSIDNISFVTAILIFSLSTAILGPLIAKIALTSAPFLMGGIALVTTLVGLVITNILSDGLSITGLSAWVISTLIVWIFSVIGNVLLPLLLFKKVLSENKASD